MLLEIQQCFQIIQYAINALLAALQINMQTSAADQHSLLLDNTYDLINPRLQSGGAWVSLRGQGKNPTWQ